MLGAGLTIWLWLADGGISAVSSPATALTSGGRITGLLAGYLLLIQVLLLVRLPFLERIAGFDRLTRWHRLNGKVCINLILAHVVLITVGYAMTRRVSIVTETRFLLTGYYGMVAAVIGTALLLVVVLTSIVIVRRRLRFETWYLVHLLSYLGIVLTWLHETRTGFDFVTHTWTAAIWAGAYIVTLQVLILFRIFQPALRAYFHRLKVVRVKPEGPGVVSVYMTGRYLDWLNAQAGQFFLWRFLSAGRQWEAHPFSLSAAPDGKSLRITVKSVGDFTGRMGQIKPGTRVVAEGPFGSLTDRARTRDRIALIAGGIGITPIRALLETMSGNIVLVYRVMTESDLIFRDELDALAQKRGFTIHYVVGDHRLEENRGLLSPEHLRRLMPDIVAREVYLCGPPAMVDVLAQKVREAGVPDKFIHVEQFAL